MHDQVENGGADASSDAGSGLPAARTESPDQNDRLKRIASVAEKGRVILSGAEEGLDRRAADLAEKLASYEGELAQARSECRSLSQGRDEARAALQRARNDTDALRSALAQRREEAAQAWAETRELRDALGELEREKASLHAGLADANGWVFRLAGERRELEKEVSQKTQVAARLSKQLEADRGRVVGLERGLAAANEARDTLKGLLDGKRDAHQSEVSNLTRKGSQLAQQVYEVEEHLEDRFLELAVVSSRLLTTEREMRGVQEWLAWLQAVSAILLRLPAWWGLLPARKRTHLRDQRLQRKGLFDGELYLARNPDVAATGIDPLWHYIFHGAGEGRARS